MLPLSGEEVVVAKVHVGDVTPRVVVLKVMNLVSVLIVVTAITQ